MPKRLWAQAFPVRLLPKALPFASTTRALPETGPGAPKRLRAGSRAALVPDWRLDEGRCWTRPRPADSQPRARSAAKRMRGRLSRVEAPFILSWGAARVGLPRTSARAIPGAAPLRHGVAGSFWQEGERSNFVRLGGFLPSAGGERRSDKGLPKTATPAPAARSQRGGTRFFAARETQGSEERAGSAAEALQVQPQASQAGFRACARCAGEDRLLSSAPHGLKRPKSEAYIPEE